MTRTLACLPLNGRAAHEAHDRLRKQLPVREHRIGDDSANTGRPAGKHPVIIAGTEYPSMRAAADAKRVSLAAIYKMLRDGRAEYA